MPHHDAAPPSPAASDSSGSTGPPRTPETTATLPLGMPTFLNFTSDGAVNGMPTLSGGVKRSKRRANTAERRATHNAVERARRETLNGRFLDLAGMLTNLSQIRRPSKSAIVNSSIAHLNAASRHRGLAAQQLRALKSEADALRAEVNEWRARAGVVKLDEPVRSDAFGVVLRGELEFDDSEIYVDGEEPQEEMDESASASADSQDQASTSPVEKHERVTAEPAAPAYVQERTPDVDEYAMLQQQRQQHAELLAAQQQQLQRHLAQQAQVVYAHPGHGHGHYYPVPASPTIVSPFETYEHAHAHADWAALEKQQVQVQHILDLDIQQQQHHHGW